MKTGDKLWVRESSAGTWLEATYEFRIELSEPLGHHSVMLASGGGRRVVCGCNTSTVDPAHQLIAASDVDIRRSLFEEIELTALAEYRSQLAPGDAARLGNNQKLALAAGAFREALDKLRVKYEIPPHIAEPPA